VSPPLTTVRIGHREMGEEAARLLLEEISGTHGAKRTITLKPALIVRSSTKKP
jgi:LacI family transcriptional regulator